MEKSIKNAHSVARKHRLALTRITNYRFEVVREEGQKKEEIVEKQKAKAMTAKKHRARGEMSLFSEKKDESYSEDDINQD